jgi:hypothetical protein
MTDDKAARKRKLEDVPIDNFYSIIPKKFMLEQRTYPNFNELQVQLPFRLCATGATGSGKTNAIMRLFDRIRAFDKIMLFAKDLTEPIYEYFIDAIQQVEKVSGQSILMTSNTIEALPEVASINKKLNTVLIIDDMISEKSKYLKRVEQYWIMGRKKHVSSIFLSQRYFAIPLMIRTNSEYFIFTKLRTTRDLTFILRDFQLGVTDEQLMEIYKKATEGGFPNFLMIDTDNKNTNYRFRASFAPMNIEVDNKPVELVDKEANEAKEKDHHDEDDDHNNNGDEPSNTKMQDQTDKQKVAKFKNPRTLKARLQSLMMMTGQSEGELREMAKSMGLSIKELCTQLEKAIVNGEFATDRYAE